MQVRLQRDLPALQAPLGIEQGTDFAAKLEEMPDPASIPSLVAPGTGSTLAADNAATERVVPDWQRRGPVDRMLVRRER